MRRSTQKAQHSLHFLSKLLPYGVIESWNDLNPDLYLSVHIFWLKFYGMWFNNYSWKDYKFWLQGSYTLVVFFLVCLLPGFGEINYLLERRGNIGHIAEGLYLFLSEMYTYFKILVFWYNKDKILKLLKFIHCDEFKPKEIEHRNIIRNRIITARFVMNAYTIMCVGAVSVGILMPITENFDILPTNVEYPWVDVYKAPAYNLIYLHHVYYKPATCIIDGAMDTMLAAFIASAIGQIEILAFNLINFKVLAKRHQELVPALHKNQIDSFRLEGIFIRNVLKQCIIHHTAIIRDGTLLLSIRDDTTTLSIILPPNSRVKALLSYGLKSNNDASVLLGKESILYLRVVLCFFMDSYVTLIEESFSLASALQFMLSVMVLCLVGIKILSIENPTSHCMQIMWIAVYLTCMLTEVFILCWFGNELILKSLELQNAAFNSPWFDIDSKSKFYIIIFMERCKRPLLVTAGKFFSLSLGTYTSLINWSYKAFAVMRNMKNNGVIANEENMLN